jgi:methylthioribose-1-phosphate isomerase
MATGRDSPIEQRGAHEVAQGFGLGSAPPDVEVFNPAFDVTPAELVTAIIHEGGVLRPPFEASILASVPRLRARSAAAAQGGA